MAPNEYPLTAKADLPGVAFASMRQVIMAQATSANLRVLRDEDGYLTVETNHGLIGLVPGAESETAGMVAAADDRWLFIMKNAVIAQMRELMPAVAEAMRWSDGEKTGTLPPNFQFVRTVSVEELGPVFLRVTLEGEDLSDHGDASIHFRLVQPPVGAPPEWPALAANGSVKWPEGEGAPHKPVYTTRSVDHRAGRLVTDIFIHEGGRTTDWAREVQAGGRARNVVGLMGPAGGGLLDAERVYLASDETGFPAAARLLENLPEGATGHVVLEAEHGADCAYPIEAPAGIEMVWLSRAKGDNLGAHALAALEGLDPAVSLWFAGERAQARALREAAKAAGWEAAQLRVSGFWAA